MNEKQTISAIDLQNINIHENYEVEHWAKEWNVSPEALKNAVKAVGTSVKDVANYLNN